MNLNNFSLLLAQAQAPAGQEMGRNPQGEMIKMVMMIAVFGIMMWLLMIRPQQKKAKEHAAMMSTLKPGDKVVTTSGIVAVVLTVKERTVTLRSADTKLEVLKSAISDITERTGESSES